MKRCIKYFLCCVIICWFNAGCKHQISRFDYIDIAKNAPKEDCDIPVKKFEPVPDTVATKIGTMRLSDTGFSSTCSEADAVVLLKKEGCAINADFVMITGEKLPDKESNCYRCQADFYVFK
jgi:hypothetical protein